MRFLSPNFLFWLFALPIPFIIHLWHRHRLKKIWFPSISLITQAKRGEKSFRRLKDIILLVLRTFALLFLILAFANPLLVRKQKIALLDDSWDMYTKSGSSTVFEEAEKIARSLKYTKILLASGKSYPSPCKYQKFYIPTKDVDYIITRKDKLPDTLDVELIQIDYEKDNFSIDSISFTPPRFLAFITNHTAKEKSRLISLFFDTNVGAVREPFLQTHVSIPPYSTSTAMFPLSEAYAGSVKIEEDDALQLDNTKYFVYSLPPAIRVLIVGSSEESFFLKNALSPPTVKSRISVKVSPTLINPTSYDVIILLQDYKITRLQDYIMIPVDAPKVEGGLTLTDISETHPIFRDFEFLDKLKEIKFDHRKKLEVQYIEPLPKVIARFSDGSPAMVEHNSGALEFLFPLNLKSKELVLSPLFPPLMHRIVYWMAGIPVERHNFVVGETVRFKVPEFKSYDCINVGNGHTCSLQSRIEPTGIYLYFTPEEPGIYEIPEITKFAVNISNSLVYPSVRVSSGDKVQNFAPLQSYVSIKKWFFFLVLLLLIAELIIRRR